MRSDDGNGQQRTGLRQTIKASVRGGKKFVRQATHPIYMAEESVRRLAQRQREDEILDVQHAVCQAGAFFVCAIGVV